MNAPVIAVSVPTGAVPFVPNAIWVNCLPEVPAPIAAYVPAALSGSYVFTSGQLPTIDGVLMAAGHVGNGADDVDVDTAKKCAERSGLNALAAVKSVIGQS